MSDADYQDLIPEDEVEELDPDELPRVPRDEELQPNEPIKPEEVGDE